MLPWSTRTARKNSFIRKGNYTNPREEKTGATVYSYSTRYVINKMIAYSPIPWVKKYPTPSWEQSTPTLVLHEPPETISIKEDTG